MQRCRRNLWNAVEGQRTREKGRDRTQSYDKCPYTHRKIQKATWQHKNATHIYNACKSERDASLSIDNPEFAKHIPDNYSRELQLNKANISDKETSFLDLNIIVIGSIIHTCVYDKRDDFGFPIVNFPWLSGDVPRLPSYGIYILQLVRYARCCTSKIFWFPF